MNKQFTLPFYAKVSLILIGMFFFISMLYIAQDIILPLIYAAVIAILISPAINLLVRIKINRTLAISIVLFIAVLFIVGLIVLIISRTNLLIEALPQMTAKFETLLRDAVKWASEYLHITTKEIDIWLANEKAQLMESNNIGVSGTLVSMGSGLTIMMLTPVYTFMLLYYQPHLVLFVHQLFGNDNDKSVTEILSETKVIIQNYLNGLLVEFVIVAVMNTVGLLLLGIEYAILLGIIGSLLNVIPYIGGIVGVALFMAVALVTKAPIYVFYVFMLYIVIQFIDNNYIVPKIVGSKVKLNALVSIIGVIAGAALWGISGMFLSIPILAIIKLISDRINPLKPWGFLLGDTMPPIVELKLKFIRLTKRI